MLESNYFTKENVEWIKALLNEAITRSNSLEKSSKLKEIVEKVEGILEPSSFVLTSEEDIANLNIILGELESLRKQYQAIHDLEAIVEYERIKKEMAGHLAYLSTIRETLIMDAMVYEDFYKKELRNSLIDEIIEGTEGRKVSMSAAEKRVELDQTYLHHKHQYFKIQRLAFEVRTKYAFYTDLWKMVMQSFSYASRRNQQ